MWLRVTRLCGAVLMASAGEQARRACCCGASAVLLLASLCAAAQSTQPHACLASTCSAAWSALTVAEAGCVNAAFVLMSARFLGTPHGARKAGWRAQRATAASLLMVCVSTVLWAAWAYRSARSKPLALQASDASTFMLACAGICATLFAAVVVAGQLCMGTLLVLPREWSVCPVACVYVCILLAVAAPRLLAGAGATASTYAAAIVASRAAVATSLSGAYAMRSPQEVLPPPVVVPNAFIADDKKDVSWMHPEA